MTDAEHKLWAALRRRQILGHRFRRQQPIGPYIADFFCPEAKLVIEVDGSQHGEEVHALGDKRRTEWLEQKGYRVLRFWNSDVLARRANVVDVIERVLLTLSGPPFRLAAALTLGVEPPSPSRGGRIFGTLPASAKAPAWRAVNVGPSEL